MLDAAGRQAVADALHEAERTATPIPPVSATWPGLEPADAYEIQRLNVARRLAAGATVRGHKVGLTSRAMQEMMGVDEPDYGHLLDDMFVFEGSTVDTARLCTPRVEVEVAFVLGADLPRTGCTAADVVRATDCVLPAIELIDSRIADWRIGLADTIADNASSSGVVLGGNPRRLTDLDVRTIGAVLRRNGEILDTGVSGAVLGNPVTAVAWLARTLGRFGVTLEAGHVVMPGSCTRAFDVRPGDTVRVDFDHLGPVEVSFR